MEERDLKAEEGSPNRYRKRKPFNSASVREKGESLV